MGTIASKRIDTIDTNTLIHAGCRRTIIDIYKMYILDIHWIEFGHYVFQMSRSYLFRNPFLWTQQGRDIDRMQFHLGIHHRYCKDFPCNRQYLTSEIIQYELNFKPKRKNKKRICITYLYCSHVQWSHEYNDK